MYYRCLEITCAKMLIVNITPQTKPHGRECKHVMQSSRQFEDNSLFVDQDPIAQVSDSKKKPGCLFV